MKASRRPVNRACMVVLGATLVVLWAFPTAALVVSIDDFLCYTAQPPKGSPRFQPQPVTLVDEFGEAPSPQVMGPLSLCNPADKDGEGIKDPATHLTGYKILLGAHIHQFRVRVQSAFGTVSLITDSSGPDRLLVPSAKCIDQPGQPCPDPVTPPDPLLHDVDHYLCHSVRPLAGTPRFPPGIQADVVDQFNQQPKRFDVKRPRRLCNPVDKNGEGIKNAGQHLMCYQAVRATGQPRHIGRRVHLNNQFGPEVLDTVGEEELCVPSVLEHKEELPE